MLTGGSAYGLASAAGAQRWCEENGRGLRGSRGSGAHRAGRGDLRPGPGRRLLGAPDAGHGLRGSGGGCGTGRKGTTSNAATWEPAPEPHRQGTVQGRSRHGLGHAGGRRGGRRAGRSERPGSALFGTTCRRRSGAADAGEAAPRSTPRSSWSPPMPCSMWRSASGLLPPPMPGWRGPSIHRTPWRTGTPCFAWPPAPSALDRSDRSRPPAEPGHAAKCGSRRRTPGHPGRCGTRGTGAAPRRAIMVRTAGRCASMAGFNFRCQMA